ncbi:hypothetical protein ABTX77_30175 [Streptomyces sp. NPDC097704]|uniref:hypothetical protein n=1 Tax=Streptomyces sp. NPDC097704 TaxID=3157101 RepID=UPI00332880F6
MCSTWIPVGVFPRAKERPNSSATSRTVITASGAVLLLEIAARSMVDPHRISGELLTVPDVVRISTVVSPREEVPPRTRALIERAGRTAAPRAAGPPRT